MKPHFARNPTDAVQCFADFLNHIKLDRNDPVVTQGVLDMPVYFISGPMGQTLATISRTFPLTAESLRGWDCGYLVFERATLSVTQDGTGYSPSGVIWWPTGAKPFWWDAPRFYRFDTDLDETAQCVGALMALVRQKLAIITRPRIGKYVLKRLKLPQREPECRVVTLRQRETRWQPLTSAPVDWSCRWMVRGHWRVLETGPTWITAHFKGPEDKALKAPGDRVFAVVR